MFKRKLMQTLLEWKNSKGKKPLLVKGARQIGKTFIIREFGKQNYENVIELNFFKYAEHRKIFEGSLDPKKIYQEISLLGLGELKAGNSTTRSLNDFIKEFNPPYALKFITGNVGKAGTKITLPLYMAMFL